MTVRIPNGAIVSLASGYGPVSLISVLTNANPGVATLAAAHGVITGDYIEVTSGWSRLTEKILRAGVVATNDVPLEGYNTVSTTIYPPGTGIGSVREITGWTQLSQILDSSSEGGEQQFLTYQFLESDAEKRIPTVKSAGGLNFTVADDPLLAGYILASSANDDRLVRAVKIVLPDSSILLYNAFVSINKTPSLTVNELMAIQVTLSLQAEPVRYPN